MNCKLFEWRCEYYTPTHLVMTEDDLSCQERQSNELEILQAMYNDDIVDLHKEDSKAVSCS